MRITEQNRGNIDALLHAYFRAEMPDPWPVLNPPAEEPRNLVFPSKGWSLIRSRLVLAACVAVLLVGSWFLAKSLPSYTIPSGNPNNGAGGANIVVPGK